MKELFVVTAISALATVFLAIATWRMASISREEFALSTRPFFAFKNIIFKIFAKKSDGQTHLRVGIIFRNPGKVPIRYDVKSMRVTFGGQTIDDPKFATRGGEIYPDDETIFWYGTILNVNMSNLPCPGVLQYEIDYSDMLKKETVTTKKKIQYTFNSLDPPNFDWIYQPEEDV